MWEDMFSSMCKIEAVILVVTLVVVLCIRWNILYAHNDTVTAEITDSPTEDVVLYYVDSAVTKPDNVETDKNYTYVVTFKTSDNSKLLTVEDVSLWNFMEENKPTEPIKAKLYEKGNVNENRVLVTIGKNDYVCEVSDFYLLDSSDVLYKK